MSNLVSGVDEYLLEWFHTELNFGESQTLQIWRQALGRALESWNLELAQRLIVDCADTIWTGWSEVWVFPILPCFLMD